jgi:hypothetical protein
MQVRNYVYISDTKIDLFYDQIASPDIEKTGAEYGVDLKILKWVGKRETEKVVTRMTKLERVVEFIEGSNKVGTVDAPSTYFAGALDMRWGSLFGDMALFVGETSQTGVALGGSVKHIIGESSGGIPPSSALPAIFSVFKKHTDAEILHDDRYSKMATTSPQDDLRYAWQVAASFRAPTQRLEFLARNYLFGPVAEKNTLLGTPFYVALAD